MAKIDIQPAIKSAEKVSNFLSDITGLPIAAVQAFPELVALAKRKHKSGDSGFNYRLALGNPGDSYEVRVAIDLKDDWTPGEWLANTGWQVLHNGREVLKRGTYVDTSTSFRSEDLTDPAKINEYLDQELQAVIGGPNTEIPFMNFERYTTGSLGNEDSYFAIIYLALMADAKERGLPIPPILSKKPEVARPMSLGDTETVDKVLAAAIIFEGSGLDARCQAHMKHEAEVIRSQAKWEHRKRDPAVDLTESFPDLEMQVIKEGKTAPRPYNILAVENDIYHHGDFIEEVVEGLGKDGRYRGARVIREVNLPACMQLCETGKVDMVLFDWSKPSSEEALMVRGNRNSWFDLVNGDVQAVLDLDGDGMKIGLPDGRVLFKDDLPKEAEELDIRSQWAGMIADACRHSKVEPPPHFIVKSRGEMRDLAKIVSQKLGRTPSQY